MDRRIKEVIASAAFDCTVGMGLGEDAPEEPTIENLAFLEYMLRRQPTAEELTLFKREHAAGIQCCTQP